MYAMPLIMMVTFGLKKIKNHVNTMKQNLMKMECVFRLTIQQKLAAMALTSSMTLSLKEQL